MIAAEPDRFELHGLSYEEIASDLEEIVGLIQSNIGGELRMLITVSPVPLYSTFRGQDCLQVNAYSKSVQRAAVEHICAKFPQVTSFPSYEMVTLSAPEIA